MPSHDENSHDKPQVTRELTLVTYNSDVYTNLFYDGFPTHLATTRKAGSSVK
jgi:hypothetical protein